METLEGLVKFISSYPIWARALIVAAILLVVATMALAPRRSTGDAGASIPAIKRVYMRINPIQLFPDDPDAAVSLSAFVNGTQYVHPSVGGVEWMQVGPQMSPKVFEIPHADRYNVRFEMRLRSGASLSHQQQQSQMVDPVAILPYSGKYNLYQVNNRLRSAGVSATITYDIFEM